MTVNNEGATEALPTGTDAAYADGGAVVTTMPSNRVAGIVRVNLLPPELAEEQVLRKVRFGAAAALLVAVAAVGALYYQQSQNLDDAKKAYAQAQADNTRLTQEQARLGNVDALFKQVDAANAMLASASAYEIHMSSYLDELSLRQPQDIWYQSVAINENPGGIPLTPAAGATGAAAATVPGAAATGTGLGTVTISGTGYVHNDVAAWLDSFAQMTGISNVSLGSSVEVLAAGKVPTVTWSTTAQLTLAALAPKTPDGSATK